jgi:hypothetical protein
MFEEEGQTASVVAKPQGSVTGWQKQPQQQQQQQQQQSGTAMTKPAPSAQPKQGPTDGAPGETHCSINYVVSCQRLAHAESSEGWLIHSCKQVFVGMLLASLTGSLASLTAMP